jgi:vanillate/3-O-methylgallate O-demethylase
VKWGDFGGKIKDVRATVARYPYLDLEPNQTHDLTRVASGVSSSVSADGAATH